MDNTINSLVSKTIGLTDQQVKNKLLANPNMNDSQIVQFMQSSGVSPSQMSKVSGIPEGQIAARVAATIPPGQSATLGDTVIVPQYQTIGSGMDQQIGNLEGFATSKTTGDVNYKAPVGTPVQIYNANGEFVNTVQTKKDQSFLGGIADALKDPVVQAAILGVAGGAGAFDGLLSGSGAAGTAGTAGTGAGSAFELANAGAGAFDGGTALNSLAGTGAGSAFEAANAGATAMTDLGASELANAGSTALSDLGASELANAGASANTAANVANTASTASNVANTANTAANAANAASTAANASNVAKTLIDPITGLAVSAAGNALGNIANQQGISEARDLINQYGTRANTALTDAYTNAQNLGAAGRRDLGNIFSNQNTNLNNIINAQAGVYGDTNTALGNIYSNTGTNLQNLYNQQVGYQEPYQDIGRAGSQGLLANQPYLTKQFGTADLNSELAPNYAFMLGQGQMANQRAGNMGGGALGGNALQGLQKYTQDYAGNAYQQAFNNFQNQRKDIYNTLSGMANIGVNSAGQLASLGNTYGSNMANLSNNYASNRVANANQMQGAYNTYGSNLTNAANTYGSNLTSNYNTGVNSANIYGTNSANLATGIGGALAGNASAAGANTATALSNLGNTALIGSMIKAT